jgi:N-acetyl-anhydromuramyl-L-alanine amidase AmpD
MKDWFSWTTDPKLKAAADLTMNGGRLLEEDARLVINTLSAESERLIKKYVGEEFYNQYYPSNRHGGNWDDDHPIGLVDHYTAGISARGTLKWFSNRDRGPGVGNSSAHFVMDRNGATMVIVDPLTTLAWHATWANRNHIGIEHVNAGLLSKNDKGELLYMNRHAYPDSRKDLPQEISGNLWEPYTAAQVVANIVLKRWLIQAIPTLTREHFVDHEIIDPERKTDCGPLWPLAELNDLVFSWRPIRPMKWLGVDNLLKQDVDAFKEEVRAYL